MKYEIGEEYDFVKVISINNVGRASCGFNLYADMCYVKAMTISKMKCIEKGLVPKIGSIHRRVPGMIFQDEQNNLWFHDHSDIEETNDITKLYQCFSIYTTHDVNHGHNELLGHVRLYEKELYLEELERAISSVDKHEQRLELELIRSFIQSHQPSQFTF